MLISKKENLILTNSLVSLNPWIMALRPKTLTAAIVPILVATSLVFATRQTVLWWVSICALLSSIFIQIGTNFVNDAIDFKKGADTTERVGPQRVTQSGLLSTKQVMFGAGVCFFVAMILGVPLVVHGGWPIVGIGCVSLFLGYGYTGGPFPLAYKGLGDLFVILFLGLVAVCGTYFLHAGMVSTEAGVAGLQVGLLATVLIAINNLRDVKQDVLVDKKTLPVRFGVRFGRCEIAGLIIVAYLVSAFWFVNGMWLAAVLPLLLAPLGFQIVKNVFSEEPGPQYNRYLGQAAKLHLIHGILTSIGLILGVLIA